MAKKIRLETSVGEVNAFIGIATQLRDYRLVHFINKFLEIDLVNVEDLPVFFPKTASFAYFPLYYYHHPDLRTDFCLLANNNGSVQMIPSLRQVNFFLLLEGAAYKQHIDDFVSSIRKIQGVQAAIGIKQSSIKEIGPILEGLEMHILEVRPKEDGNQ